MKRKGSEAELAFSVTKDDGQFSAVLCCSLHRTIHMNLDS